MIDGIIHIADVPALVAFFAQHAPEKLDEDGQSITGFTRTPTVVNGTAALTYVRVTPEEAAAFRVAPGVTVLAQAPYEGTRRGNDLYAAIHGHDPETGAVSAVTADVTSAENAAALYDAVWPRGAVEISDGDGGTVSYAPPQLFGELG
jgi:hypothetical protein